MSTEQELEQLRHDAEQWQSHQRHMEVERSVRASYEQRVKLLSDRTRNEHDFYPTPLGLVHAALSLVKFGRYPELVLDPGAGSGVWGQGMKAVYPKAEIAGTDLRPLSRPVHYDYWQTGVNFLGATPAPVFDWVIGNPPYKYAEDFVRLGYAFLQPDGIMIYLLRLAFLEGQTRSQGLWVTHAPHTVAVCGKRPSFTGNGKTDATAYAVFVWMKGNFSSTRLTWLQWTDAPALSTPVHQLPMFTESEHAA